MYDEYGDYVEDDSVYRDEETDVGSVSSASKSILLNENVKRQKKMMEELKKIDKGYYKIYRYVNDKNKSKKKSIEIYSTETTPGFRIRGAITGSHYSNFKVGSKDEDIFYKVAICTGECKENNSFYFDNPEQYERHMQTTVSQSEKEEWYEKFNRERTSRQ
jgi:hypothetical protein